MRLRLETHHTSDGSDCPDARRCKREHIVSPNLTTRPYGVPISVAQAPVNRKVTNVVQVDGQVKKSKKPKDKSREVTSKDMLPSVLINNTGAENKSSVEIKQTAKLEPLVEVKIYQGTTEEEAKQLADIAVAAYKRTRNAVDKIIKAANTRDE